jgi:hypothetical protein
VRLRRQVAAEASSQGLDITRPLTSFSISVQGSLLLTVLLGKLYFWRVSKSRKKRLLRGENPRQQASFIFGWRHLPTQPGHCPRHLQKPRRFGFRRTAFPAKSEGVRNNNTKTDVVIAVIRVVPVTVRTAGVPLIVVERTAAQNAVHFGQTPHDEPDGPGVTVLSQPPNSLPNSATISEAWRY